MGIDGVFRKKAPIKILKHFKEMKKKNNRVWHILKIVLATGGFIFLTFCILALTTLPYWAYYNLGTTNSKITVPPRTIVLLSGTGIPSESGLLRAYYTAHLAKANPEAHIVISIPGDLSDSMGAAQLTAGEIILRGIAKERIHFENTGRNTREQAQKLAAGKTSTQLNEPVTLVTSPDHMKRAVLAFRKCGFTKVSGLPTFEHSLESDLSFKDSDLKGNKMAPPIGNNLQVRYQFWTHLKLEILVIREYFGLAYYRMRGWV
jgi:uncharacterized SAM-binding protein YcdF (DUF218 family)